MARTRSRFASRAALPAAVLVLSACGAGEPPVRSTGAGSPPSEGPEQPTSSAVPPVATFDPVSLGAPGAAPLVETQGTDAVDGVTTEDVTFSRDELAPTEAYLVRPTKADGRSAAIVWFHWLESGAPTSGRAEFLEEARGLARQGVVSLLVQGTFPWNERPSSIAHDLSAVTTEVRMVRAAIDLVAARDDVDVARIGLVGHDFGAMYASVVFGSDPRPAALVMMAPTARWGDWFLRYWAISDAPSDYSASLAPLDPVSWLPAAQGRPILLQFASRDRYVPKTVADAIAAAAGAAAETRTYDAEHALDEQARTERDAWLAAHLGLP